MKLHVNFLNIIHLYIIRYLLLGKTGFVKAHYNDELLPDVSLVLGRVTGGEVCEYLKGRFTMFSNNLGTYCLGHPGSWKQMMTLNLRQTFPSSRGGSEEVGPTPSMTSMENWL